MMKFIYTLLLTLISISAFSQDLFNMELVATVNTDSKANDIWGFVDGSGIEYAIMGTRDETFIYDLSVPEDPQEILRIPGNYTVWRDFKDYNNFIYGTADAGDQGLLIIDMNAPQDSIPWQYYNEEITVKGLTSNWGNCHNLYIDDDGLAYFSGCDFNNGGVIIFDLNPDPWIPTFAGTGIAQYSHDNFSRDSIIYSADIKAGTFTIQDVRDLNNPILLIEESTTSEKAHNIWPSDDGKYVFTTDETSFGNLDAYDVSDPNNVELLDFYRPERSKGDPVIPHNTHYLNGYLVTSWYTEGIVIVDGNKPDNLVPVAQYDTYDPNSFGFNGCWGAYPYLPSGLVIGADIQSGLFVLQPTYQRACYLEGMIRDENGDAINNANVEILDDFKNLASSKSSGAYKTGLHKSGTFDVLYTHPHYYDTIHTVELINGEVSIQDVKMRAKKIIHFQATVRDANTHIGIENAIIQYTNEDDIYYYTTDENGQVELEVREGNYRVLTGAWAYHTQEYVDFVLNENTGAQIFELNPGYRDEFELDFGWELNNMATGGIWERGEPRGTPLQPDMDVPTDIGVQCYVTGNNGTSINDDDIDGGRTTIISPEIDLSQLGDPALQFSYWFANFDLNSNISTEDSLVVLLSQENQLDQVLFYTNLHELAWKKSPKIPFSGFIYNPDEPVRIKYTIGDVGDFNWLEAALDEFVILDLLNTSQEFLTFEPVIAIFPNPSQSTFNIILDEQMKSTLKRIELVDQMGRPISSFFAKDISTPFGIDAELDEGVYSLLFITETAHYVRRIVKIKK